ncbi:hypothetical protein V8G54_026635 [Vigna mungo]|uniref:Glutaredoxin domain-containing protein n=1 Tax=Vigna mungo TaxID=3915 RepID=A0AAQ3N0Q7_VIGMU
MHQAIPFRSWRPLHNPTTTHFTPLPLITHPHNNTVTTSSSPMPLNMVWENAVTVVGRRGCCMTHVVNRLLLSLGVNPALYEVEENDEAIVATQLEATVRTEVVPPQGKLQFPAVFIGGKLFGGLDRIMSTHISGELLVKCLAHDDLDSRVSGIMGKKKTTIDWFNCSKDLIQGQGSSVQTPTPPPQTARVVNLEGEEEIPLKRKRKVVPLKEMSSEKRMRNPSKGTAVDETGHLEADRDLPSGVWDAGFDLGYKIDPKLDPAEMKVLKNTPRQQLRQHILEFCARAIASTLELIHMDDQDRAEVEDLQKQLMDLTLLHSECEPKYKAAEKMINEGRVILENMKTSFQATKKEMDRQTADLAATRKALNEVTIERNTLKNSLIAAKAREREMAGAIILEHTRGFKKAIRQATFLLDRPLQDLPLDVEKDILHGKIVPSREVPAGTYPDDEEEEEVAVSVQTDAPPVETNNVPFDVTEVPIPKKTTGEEVNTEGI